MMSCKIQINVNEFTHLYGSYSNFLILISIIIS